GSKGPVLFFCGRNVLGIPDQRGKDQRKNKQEQDDKRVPGNKAANGKSVRLDKILFHIGYGCIYFILAIAFFFHIGGFGVYGRHLGFLDAVWLNHLVKHQVFSHQVNHIGGDQHNKYAGGGLFKGPKAANFFADIKAEINNGQDGNKRSENDRRRNKQDGRYGRGSDQVEGRNIEQRSQYAKY